MNTRLLLTFHLLLWFLLAAPVKASEEEDMKNFKSAYAQYNTKVDSGDLNGALPFAKQAYELGGMLFEPESQNMLALTDNYAFNLEKLGRTKEAENVYLELISENEEFYGRYAKSLIPMLEGLSKIVAKTSPEKSKAYALRALKLNMRHNSMEMSQKISQGKLKRPKNISKLRKGASRVANEKFKELESENWIILYQEGHEEGAELLQAQAELSYRNIRSFLLALNFTQKPIKQKLVALMFGSQEEYLLYLESQGFSTRSKGSFYHDADALLIYDEIHRRSQWEYFKRTNVVSAETAQYVAVRSKLMSRERDHYPRWLYDGLGSTFEFNDIEQDFGPHTENLSARNWEFAQGLIDDGEWKSLTDFIRMTQSEEMARPNKPLVYYMGTFLVRFLYTYHSDELIEYFRELPRTMDPENQSRNDRLKSFRKVFGDPKKLESDWRRFLQSFGITFPA